MNEKLKILHAFNSSRTEILSSLSLQIALHYNIAFAPFWAISIIIKLIIKFDYLSSTYMLILPTIYFMTIAIEFIRLFLGYYGNLGEKVPALSGFWIITLILQVPIEFYLLFNPNIISLPLEQILSVIHLIFITVQLYVGFFAIRKIMNCQMERYRQRVLFVNEQKLKKA